jgi:hypothetical protein
MLNVKSFIDLIAIALGNPSDFRRPYVLQLADEVHKDLILGSKSKDTVSDLADTITSYFDYDNMSSLVKQGVMLKLQNSDYGTWLERNGIPDFRSQHGSNVSIVRRDSERWL